MHLGSAALGGAGLVMTGLVGGASGTGTAIPGGATLATEQHSAVTSDVQSVAGEIGSRPMSR